MKNLLRNKQKSSFNVGDVWVGLHWKHIMRKNTECLVLKGDELCMPVVAGRYLCMWYRLIGSVSDFTYWRIWIWNKCESVCFSSALFSFESQYIESKGSGSLLWHEHRQSLTERGRKGGRVSGREGKESVSFLSVKAKENKAHQRTQIPISGCFRTS